MLAANRAMVLLYWDIGRSILTRQAREGWGARTIDGLAYDLRDTFPDMRGFSPRNLKYMRAFAAAWPDHEIVQEVLAQITWTHNVALLEKVEKESERLWYAARAREAGWSRNVLALQIESRAHEREGGAMMNLYLSAVDDLMRHPQDAPTIGLLLCKGKDRLIVEYALRDLAKPLGVAGWETRLTASLPDGLKGTLPTIEEIEATMSPQNEPQRPVQ